MNASSQASMTDYDALILDVARWIAEALGGRLALESSSRSGSCFIVTLPAN